MEGWQIVDPEGNETTVPGDLTEACERHDMLGCILAGCPDAFGGWRATDLATGRTIVPEEVEDRVLAALDAAREAVGDGDAQP
jgi:hypothetical protein